MKYNKNNINIDAYMSFIKMGIFLVLLSIPLFSIAQSDGEKLQDADKVHFYHYSSNGSRYSNGYKITVTDSQLVIHTMGYILDTTYIRPFNKENFQKLLLSFKDLRVVKKVEPSDNNKIDKGSKAIPIMPRSGPKLGQRVFSRGIDFYKKDTLLINANWDDDITGATIGLGYLVPDLSYLMSLTEKPAPPLRPKKPVAKPY